MESQETWFWLFDWIELSWLGATVRESIWAVAVFQAVHLLGLCLLGGALLTVDLRMLGLGLRNEPINTLARQLRPWLVTGLAISVTTGVLIFPAAAVRYYYNTSFWVKASVFTIAILFTFLVRARVAEQAGSETTARTRLVGAISIALWFVVAAAGRWIGYS